MLILSKLLPLFVYPLGLGIVLGLLALVLSLVGFRRLSRLALVVAIVVLWGGSTPVFATWLYAGLEGQYPPRTIEETPSADVAIVLGGIVGQPLPPRVTPELGGASDRILEAVRLWRAGKVKAILVTAGNLPWTATVKPEADLIGALLEEFGVPRDVIILDRRSRNTHENAVNAAAIWKEKGFHSGLLVTSAAHMPRALATFRAVGLPVTPASVDIVVTEPGHFTVFSLLPDAGALSLATRGVKEWLGLFVYRLRGWAKESG